MSLTDVVLLLGSNLGDKEENLRRAIKEINIDIGVVSDVTDILYSEPVDYVSDSVFCNIALRVKTSLGPIALLNTVKTIEKLLGRNLDTRQTHIHTDRTIDIDIVKYGGMVYMSDRLMIPHKKHLYKREFSKILLNLLEVCKKC